MHRLLRPLIPTALMLCAGAAITIVFAWYYASAVIVTFHPIGSMCFESAQDSIIPTMTRWRASGAERVLWNGTMSGISIRDQDFSNVLFSLPEGTPAIGCPSWTKENLGGPVLPDDAASFDSVVEDARGWPWLALRCTLYLRDGKSTGATSAYNAFELLWVHNGDASFGASLGSGGIALATRDGNPDHIGKTARALPLIPIWPGFALDTLCFSAPMLVPHLLWCTFKWTRRQVWRRTGRCGLCGYQLIVDQTVCPECGWTRN